MGAAPGMNATDSHCYHLKFKHFSNINTFQIVVSHWLSSRALKWLLLPVSQIILVLNHKLPSFLNVFTPVSVLLYSFITTLEVFTLLYVLPNLPFF